METSERRMRGMRAVALISLAAGMLVADGCAAAAVRRVRKRIEASQPQQAVVELGVGNSTHLEFTASGGTGYEWTASKVDPVVSVSAPKTTALDPGRVGGETLWTFEVTGVTAGPGRIQFELSRPWEKGVPAAQVVTIPVRVDPQ